MAPHPHRMGRGAWLAVAAVVLAACVVAVASAEGFDPDSHFAPSRVSVLHPVPSTSGATVIRVESQAVGHPIQPGFVGLSLEYTTIEPYAGRDPRAIDPVLVQLIRNLAPGQRPVLRIGGDSTDWAWWPVPHVRQPVGIRIVLGPRLGSVLGSLGRALDARLILGIDLEVDNRALAAYEATRLIRSVGRGAVQALELGNEPELYATWPWFAPPGRPPVMGRPPGYGVPAYLRDFRWIAEGLPAVGLAGPALGGPQWIHHVAQFIDAEPRVALATIHTYPLQHCYTPLVAPTYPTLGHLLGRGASQGLAGRLAATVRAAHSEGVPVRVDETNNVSCGGAPGISNTFASALWALDTMFAMARTGVDGVNIHTFENATYRLFRMRLRAGRWQGAVAPEYYGLLMFSRAAPPGSRLLRISGGGGTLRAWATRTGTGTTRIVLINDNTSRPRVAVVHPPTAAAPAAYQALVAPGIRAARGISLGGASFGRVTETGILPGPERIVARPVRGAYVLRLPPASAAMLTVPAAG